MSRLYQNLRSPTNLEETYGEILPPSVDKLLSTLSLTNEDIFLDLGSGLGKIVIQAFLNYPFKESYGIELIPELHAQAEMAGQKFQQEFPDRKLIFLQGNFLEMTLPQATVVLICGCCFGPSFLDKLGTILDAMPSVHTILTLRPINTLQRFYFKKAIRVECSWDTALCYAYST